MHDDARFCCSFCRQCWIVVVFGVASTIFVGIVVDAKKEELADNDIWSVDREVIRSVRQMAVLDKNFPSDRWDPSTPISFYFDESIPESSKLRKVVREATGFWANNSCVELSENGTTKPRVRFYLGAGCSAAGEGRPLREAQELRVSVADSCAFFASIAHVVGHVLGLLHTHTRPDRDDFVEVFESELPKNIAKEFEKAATDEVTTLNVDYDYGSVMHYTAYHQKTGKMLMRAKNPRYQHTMGNTNGPSFLDLLILNRYYGCAIICQRENAATVNCTNNGFQNPKNCSTCVCPGGFGGKDCSERAASEGGVPKNCGLSLVATTESQEIVGEVVAKAEGQIRPAGCHYSLLAPDNAHVEIKLTKIGGRCTQECIFGAVEIKFENMTKTGARLCCQEHLTELGPITSVGSLIIVSVFSLMGPRSYSMEYRAVPSAPVHDDNVSSTPFPDIPETSSQQPLTTTTQMPPVGTTEAIGAVGPDEEINATTTIAPETTTQKQRKNEDEAKSSKKSHDDPETVVETTTTAPSTTTATSSSTTTTPKTTPEPTAPAGGDCVDSQKKCKSWALSGFCTFKFVDKSVQKRLCQKTCGLC